MREAVSSERYSRNAPAVSLSDVFKGRQEGRLSLILRPAGRLPAESAENMILIVEVCGISDTSDNYDGRQKSQI